MSNGWDDYAKRKAQEDRNSKGCMWAIVGFVLLALVTPRDKTELVSGGITILLFGIAIGSYLATKDR